MRLYLSILIFVALQVAIETNTTASYCLVRQPKFSYNFDFSELTNEYEDYVIKHKEYNFLKLQLCKPLKDKCNGFNDTAICHYNGKKQFAIAKEPPEVVLKFGQTIFKYTGEKCKTNRNYTVNIEMICDLTAKETNQIKWLPSGDDCSFSLQWRTVNACSQRQQVKCSLRHESGLYDVSSLINYSDNYEVFVSNKYLAVLNVCHSVLYRPNSCQSNNAACLVSNENQGDSTNLGIPNEDLKYDPVNKSLSLTYTDGSICTARKARVNHIRTTITFVCDLNATETLPEYVGGMEQCQYQFKWVTAAACSEEALKNKSLKKSRTNTCTVRSPLNNYTFNFSSLMNREFSGNRFSKNEYFSFSVCGPLQNSSCQAGSGVCQINDSISGGMANSNLIWKESGPYLNYTNGTSCGRNNQRSYTIIEIYCDKNEDNEIEETSDPCYNRIKMSTNLACDKSIQSCVTYNKEVNLGSLKRKLSNYVIKSGDSEYRLNVCNSLVKQEGLNCPSGTAICKITHERGHLNKPISLGYPNENLLRNTDRSALLMYRNGSTCEEDEKRNIESSISFLCDISGKNDMPHLSFYKDCTYFFEWRTELVCGLVNGKLNERNCSISNGLGDLRDLSFLQEYLGSRYAINSRRIYNISLCGHAHCKKGFICTNGFNYGIDASVLFDYSVNLIRIHFTGGTKCGDGSNAKSSITLICERENLSTEPVIIREDSCNIELEWKTSKICQNLNYVPKKSIILPATSDKSQAYVNITAIKKSLIIHKDVGSQGKSKISDSNGLNGLQITGIIVVIAFVVGAFVYIVKRWKPSRNNFSIFVI